jgi:hypothetical protein
MKQQTSHRGILAIVFFGLALVIGCSGGSDSPTGPSTTISAPTAVSPTAGSTVSTAQPTLTVTNVSVSDGSSPTYAFQVATDSSFSNIVAQASGIGQGGDGQTSWQVSPALGTGQHFWRARASAGNTDGPFSTSVEFSVFTAFQSDVPREGVLVFDPLTNGSSVGDVGGGEFTPEGWKVIASSNYIVYDLPTIESGSVEFDITGLDIRNPTRDARQLFIMWDPSQGSNFTTNCFRVSLQKLDGRSSINDKWLRLRFISQCRQIDDSSTFRGWIPTKVHHVRLEWGREGEVNAARLFIDDDEKMFFQYRRPYIPVTHRIELGAAMRAESPENAIYSNVKISKRE